MSTPTDANAASDNQSVATAVIVLNVCRSGVRIHVERWLDEGEFPWCAKGFLRPSEADQAYKVMNELERLAEEADQF